MTMSMKAVAKIGALACAGSVLAMGIQHPGRYEPRPPPKREADAVQRAVPFLMSEGAKWIEEKKCISCHMVPFMLWSLTEAEAAGAEVPGDEFRVRTQWSLDDARTRGIGAGAEGLTQMILARGSAERVEGETAYYEEFAKILLDNQRADGSWKPGGQLPGQKRPAVETMEVTTMWAMLALDDALGDDATVAIDSARDSVDDGAARTSNEWHVVRLLVARRFKEEEVASRELARILERQNADGGWGWNEGEESDAFATGQSLYALSQQTGFQVDAAIANGREYLMKTQREDGAWATKSTLRRHRANVTPTGTYWGTTWAVMGLSRTNGTASATAAPDRAK